MEGLNGKEYNSIFENEAHLKNEKKIQIINNGHRRKQIMIN